MSGYKVFLLFFLLFFLIPPFAQGADDPAASLTQTKIQTQEITASPVDQRYTSEAFSALTDEEKRNVYFNLPQMLPEDFSPEPYINIFHPGLQ